MNPNTKLICIGGIPGVGKSTIGEHLFSFLHQEKTVLICPDKTRLEVLGRLESSFVTKEDMNVLITQKTIARMIEKTKNSIALNMTVIVPSAFVYENMRLEFEKIATDTGITFYGFWLEAPYETIKSRAEKRAYEQNSISAIIPNKDYKEEGQISWHIIDANRPVEDVFKNLLRYLREESYPHK